MYRRGLRRRAGVDAQIVPGADAESMETAAARSRADTVVIAPAWSVEPDRLAAICERLRDSLGNDRRLMLLDYAAQTSAPFFGALPHLDRYLKRQTLADPAMYQRDFAGGFIVTDWWARHTGESLDGWRFGVVPDPAQAHKIHHCWNFGVIRRYRWMLRLNRIAARPLARRPIDLHARLGSRSRTGREEWYQRYRQACREAVDAVPDSVSRTPPTHLSRREYFKEMARCRVVFSPFGWGEVCYRDYEAVACGCALLKPRMDHVATEPDIYRADETCLACEWDNSDVTQRIEEALDNIKTTQRIAQQAREVYREYLEGGGIHRTFRRALL